jgi:uncharacterized protein (TIGR02996 family)
VVIARLHYERPGETFVELWTEGDQLWRAWGVGPVYRGSRCERFKNAAQAAQALDRQALRLERKGFWAGVHNLSLLAAIQSRPAEPAGYLVYADWLLERSDPRGELIARMARHEPFDALLSEHRAQLAPVWMESLDCTWRLGFLKELFARTCDLSLLRRVFRHPSAQLLEAVRFERAVWLPGRDWTLARRPPC